MQTADDPAHRQSQTIFTFVSLFISTFSLWGINSLEASQEAATLAPTPETVTQETLVYAGREPVTQFSTQITTLTETENIPFTSVITENPDWEFDQQEIQQIGVNGKIQRTYQVELFYGEEISRTLTQEIITEPVEEIVLKGTKPKHIETPQGPFAYTQSPTVWSTSYDGNCKGCNGITATGTTVTHGICAVDPKVIPLGTVFYVPGYGMCKAADTGGAIKGNKIDLGFENVQFGWWSSRWVTIYLP
jgi:3D (Asp-Asp-Asp) domain-containing protein